MNTWLEIEISQLVDSTCTVSAKDESDFSTIEIDLRNLEFVEFMVYNNEEKPFENTLIMRDAYRTDARVYSVPLSKEGLFTYYKMIIPKINHYYDPTNSLYEIAGKIFYNEGKLYKGISNISSPLEINWITTTEISNPYELWDVNTMHSIGISYYFNSYVINICNIRKCLLNLQMESINMSMSNTCDKEYLEDLKMKRDFMLDTVFAIEYLIYIDQFFEAQRVIDSISSCGYICSDDYSTINSNCNCG